MVTGNGAGSARTERVEIAWRPDQCDRTLSCLGKVKTRCGFSTSRN